MRAMTRHTHKHNLWHKTVLAVFTLHWIFNKQKPHISSTTICFSSCAREKLQLKALLPFTLFRCHFLLASSSFSSYASSSPLHVTRFKYKQFCIPACRCCIHFFSSFFALTVFYRAVVCFSNECLCQKETLFETNCLSHEWMRCLDRTIFQRLKIKVISSKWISIRNKIGFNRIIFG